MRKRIKVTGFKDWDTMFYNNLLSVPILVVMSLVSRLRHATHFRRPSYRLIGVSFPLLDC